MKAFLAILFLAGSLLGTLQAQPIEVSDVDGERVTLNRKGGVTAVIYSNAAVQKETRATAKFFDPFHGHPAFRGIVVVDLRKSVAGWVKGMTLSIIRSDLEKEALRVKPFYMKNGNLGDPRADLSVIADFKGEACPALGWPNELKQVEVIVYGPDGKEAGRWQKDKDVEVIRAVVKKLLEGLPPEKKEKDAKVAE